MSPPQISVDVALTLLRNSDTNFLIGYENSIPDPRYLTIEQRKDHTAAVLGNTEPHKFIYFHFRKVDDWVRSKQIIMHKYPNARHHDWNNQDDINKLNVFRIAAITLGLTGTDVSVGERCWSVVPKSLKRMWFPNLNNPIALVHSTTQAGAEASEEQQGSAEAEGGMTPEAFDDHSVVVDSSDDDDLSSDGVRDRQALRAYQATQTALASSSNIPVGSPILNPELSSVSTHSGSPILYSPFIGSSIVGPQPLSLPAEIESLSLNDDPDAMDFELENSVNNEGYGESSLL
ncbi:hypothetical protein BPAE_0636g00020 [Botrytis paeoniae]|uniref:Uncharacterized protein n=1 Tax=Botrytis paeoniae TaxID=278948 RepID=A0A4Z1EQJ0_9HELO|nr:hypothetical protein BPAE_0636g00020 [Botrytis paeoniae]